jgi:hypothetical protein
VALPGETILLGAPARCCGPEPLTFQVLRSGAGWYIGTICTCGPYTRESRYFETEAQALDALRRWNNRRPGLTWPSWARTDGRIV